MRILYVAGRWDPTVQNEYSGSDFGAYHMLIKQPNTDVKLVEPLDDTPNLVERFIFKIYHLIYKKRLIKYFPSSLRKTGKIVQQAIEEHQPDVIFSKYSAPLVHVKIDRPFVYMCDSTVKWTKDIWPVFSKIGFSIMEKWEAKSILACNRLITFSNASAEVIISDYNKEPERIEVMPIPAYIPKHLIPAKEGNDKLLRNKLNLLLVGKRFKLRGMDIAIEVVQLLNQKGCPTTLHIVGLDGDNREHVKFMGVFNKEDPDEIKAYFDNFIWADMLIHPSRFHSAGIVISEAAAFGLPTITNASGGLATTVVNNVTGIVLPKDSPPNRYVEAILSLKNDRERFQNFRTAARERFDNKLNWESSGKHLFEIINAVVQNNYSRIYKK